MGTSSYLIGKIAAPVRVETPVISNSKPRSGWIVQVGAFEDVAEAKEKLAAAETAIAAAKEELTAAKAETAAARAEIARMQAAAAKPPLGSAMEKKR